MTNGAHDLVSAGPGGELRPCQCAWSPSPSVDTMPIPVIQASRSAGVAFSAIGWLLHREGEGGCRPLHMRAEFLVGEFDHPEGDLGIAGELAAVVDLGFGSREPRSFMQECCGDLEPVTGLDEGAQLRLFDSRQERHARESGRRDNEPPRGLCHAFDEQHSRHQRQAGEMALENRRLTRNGGQRANGAVTQVEVEDPIDQLKIFETHTRCSCALGFMRRCIHLRRIHALLAATRPSICAHRFFRTKYCSVVALPSLTSWVHCSSGILIPNALSIANATSRKSRLSMPRSLIAWLSGLIVSRGISHVSAMILATASKVDDIFKSLIRNAFRRPSGCSQRHCGCSQIDAPRTAPSAAEGERPS